MLNTDSLIRQCLLCFNLTNGIFFVAVIRPGTKDAEGLTKIDLDKRMKVNTYNKIHVQNNFGELNMLNIQI